MKKANNTRNTNNVLAIISFLVPLIGFILFFAKQENNPDAAEVYLWSAIGGFILGLCVFL